MRGFQKRSGCARRSSSLPAIEWSILERRRNLHEISEDFSALSFQLRGSSCVEHLYSVASGLKSMVIGETEVLGQLKDAYEIAQTHGFTGKWLNRLFQSSFAASKSVRSRTAITRGHVSVGSVSVNLAEQIFGEKANKPFERLPCAMGPDLNLKSLI
jgi:glutamyl-tRNA reductase